MTTTSPNDYDAIAAAVMETDRGRWFLGEYARRNRVSDTSAILDALAVIEKRLPADPAFQLAAPTPEPKLDFASTLQGLHGVSVELQATLDSLSQNARVRRAQAVLKRMCEIIDNAATAMDLSVTRPTAARAPITPEAVDTVVVAPQPQDVTAELAQEPAAPQIEDAAVESAVPETRSSEPEPVVNGHATHFRGFSPPDDGDGSHLNGFHHDAKDETADRDDAVPEAADPVEEPAADARTELRANGHPIDHSVNGFLVEGAVAADAVVAPATEDPLTDELAFVAEDEFPELAVNPSQGTAATGFVLFGGQTADPATPEERLEAGAAEAAATVGDPASDDHRPDDPAADARLQHAAIFAVASAPGAIIVEGHRIDILSDVSDDDGWSRPSTGHETATRNVGALRPVMPRTHVPALLETLSEQERALLFI